MGAGGFGRFAGAWDGLGRFETVWEGLGRFGRIAIEDLRAFSWLRVLDEWSDKPWVLLGLGFRL